MKKRRILSLAVPILAISALVIFAVQFFTGGRNPYDPILFVLLMLTGGSAEAIAFALFRSRLLKLLPLALSIAVALWGTYLFLFSPSWSNAAPADLICSYCSPMAGSVISAVLLRSASKK